MIVVVEDDQIIQALAEAGFEPAIAASGEEAVTLLRGNRSHYRALVAAINVTAVAQLRNSAPPPA